MIHWTLIVFIIFALHFIYVTFKLFTETDWAVGLKWCFLFLIDIIFLLIISHFIKL